VFTQVDDAASLLAILRWLCQREHRRQQNENPNRKPPLGISYHHHSTSPVLTDMNSLGGGVNFESFQVREYLSSRLFSVLTGSHLGKDYFSSESLEGPMQLLKALSQFITGTATKRNAVLTVCGVHSQVQPQMAE
jgi:hypothetical protein